MLLAIAAIAIPYFKLAHWVDRQLAAGLFQHTYGFHAAPEAIGPGDQESKAEVVAALRRGAMPFDSLADAVVVHGGSLYTHRFCQRPGVHHHDAASAQPVARPRQTMEAQNRRGSHHAASGTQAFERADSRILLQSGLSGGRGHLQQQRVRNLNLDEAATLAGFVQRPSHFNPLRYPDHALERRNIVLALMRENHYITADEYENA